MNKCINCGAFFRGTECSYCGSPYESFEFISTKNKIHKVAQNTLDYIKNYISTIPDKLLQEDVKLIVDDLQVVLGMYEQLIRRMK